MSNQVTAQVILRSTGGSSILTSEEPITAENIAKYRVGKEVIEEVSRRLEKLGFKVLQAGPVSLTISGEKTLFEGAFQTNLEVQSPEVGASSFYTATTPIKLPEDLAAQVADIVFPTPPQFFP